MSPLINCESHLLLVGLIACHNFLFEIKSELISFICFGFSLKAGGKKLQRVSVSVSPKGIEVNDQVTGETLHQISIYRISYCSADANYGNVFAFVSSSNLDFSDSYDLNISDPSSSSSTSSSTSPSPVPDGPLVCHVFLCPKRKIAQAMAMTVAKSFERAFEIWKLVSHRRSVHQQRPRCAQKNPFPSSNQPMAISDDVEKKAEEEKMVSLLIDFNAELTSELCSKDGRSYLQNTWVSFDEHHENAMSNLHKNASWGSNTLCS